jgi:hypothetical protein
MRGQRRIEPNEQGAVGPAQMQSAWCALLQNIQLMPQYQDFGFQPPPRLEAVAQHADEKEANCNHATIMFRFAADRESCGQNIRKRQRLADVHIRQRRMYLLDFLKKPAASVGFSINK